MIETIAGIGVFAVGGAIAYGDIRYRIGKLEGKMDLISKNLTVIMNNSNHKE